jgi:hypothetical protein
MKRGHLLPGIAAIVAVPVLSLGLTVTALQASASPVHASATPRLLSEQPVVLGCPGQGPSQEHVVRPGQYVLSCADGNDYLADVHWSSWAAGQATGVANQEVNNCIPFCYDGHFRSYPVSVTLWGSAAVPGHPGEQRYTEVTLRYPGARPMVYQNGHQVEGPKTVTVALPSGSL